MYLWLIKFWVFVYRLYLLIIMMGGIMVCNFLFYESWVIGVHALGATTKTADAYSSSLAEDCEIILLAHQWESINCHFATVKGLVVTQTALQQLKVTAIGYILMATSIIEFTPIQYICAGIESKLFIRYPSRPDLYPWPVTVDLAPTLTHN